MSMQQEHRRTYDEKVERDYQAYRVLVELWSKENPIKTAKLQVLLAVNALLVSAVNVSGGNWYIYLAGALFSFIWMFSIGRTSLFQDVWQIKIKELQDRYPNDPRFSILDTDRYQKQAGWMLQAFGALSSKWYLLFSPLVFGLAWLTVLIFTVI